MKTLIALIQRNCKLFFKDKGMFFSSLITPLILLILYVTFLGNIYKEIFQNALPEGTEEKLINALVGGQLISSLLAVCCVTVSFCVNLLMVQDRVTEAEKDFQISPVKNSTFALGYYLSTVLVTLLICFVAIGISFLYLFCMGWYMSLTDLLLLLVDVFLLVLFGTALSSVIHFFLSSQGQMSAVGTIVSCAYGFLCGAYMPISQFGSTLQKVLCFLPGTYGTSLLRNHALNGSFLKMSSMNWPEDIIEKIKDLTDCNIYFFSAEVSTGTMYLILCLTIVFLMLIYILQHRFLKKKK